MVPECDEVDQFRRRHPIGLTFGSELGVVGEGSCLRITMLHLYAIGALVDLVLEHAGLEMRVMAPSLRACSCPRTAKREHRRSMHKTASFHVFRPASRLDLLVLVPKAPVAARACPARIRYGRSIPLKISSTFLAWVVESFGTSPMPFVVGTVVTGSHNWSV